MPAGGLRTESRFKGAVGLPVVVAAPLQATVATKSKADTDMAVVVTVLPVIVVLSIPLPIGPVWSTPVYTCAATAQPASAPLKLIV